MLKPGDKVILFYSEGKSEYEAPGFEVIEYDNGLLKVYKPGKEAPIRKTLNVKPEDTKPTIFNMRSTNFFKVEMEG